jgi:hypothetical protein
MQETVNLIQRYEGRDAETITLANIPLDEIVMPGFQRERYSHHISKIAAEFDLTAYAFPICTAFKDLVFCIDGQQRLAALEKNEATYATVLLIEGITKEARLASVYLAVNRDRKLLNALEKYIGAIAARDRGTLEIAKIVNEFGYEIAKAGSTTGKVPAGAITSIHETGGGDLLSRVLWVRTQAWGPEGGREANEGTTLKGLAQFLRRYWDKIDDDHLVSVLKKQHPGFILQAVNRRTGTMQRMTYADYLREQYNRARRGKGGRL